MIGFTIRGKVPAKSNNYKIVRRGTKTWMMRAPEITGYQKHVADVVNSYVTKHGQPFPTEKVILWLVWHRLVSDGRRRDVDNILKVIKDGVTDSGLWGDDSQVSVIQVECCFDELEEEWLDMMIMMDPLQPSPLKRSSSTSKTKTMTQTPLTASQKSRDKVNQKRNARVSTS